MTDQQKVREAFPRYAAYRHLRAYGAWPSGVPDWAKNHEGSMDDVTLRNAVIDELAQAALSHASSATVKENLTVGEVDSVCAHCNGTGEVIEHCWEHDQIVNCPECTQDAPSAEDARDAARYRFLRSSATIHWNEWVTYECLMCLESEREAMDRNIDSAIAKCHRFDQALAAERGEGNG